MTAPAALVLVIGLLAYVWVDHLLRQRRAAHYPALSDTSPHDPYPEPEEPRMALSNQQLRTLGLQYVRRAVAEGKYTENDLERWEKELGCEVREIVRAAHPGEAPVKRQAKLASLKKDELVAMAKELELEVKRADGQDGEPTKDDYVAALTEKATVTATDTPASPEE